MDQKWKKNDSHSINDATPESCDRENDKMCTALLYFFLFPSHSHYRIRYLKLDFFRGFYGFFFHFLNKENQYFATLYS